MGLVAIPASAFGEGPNPLAEAERAHAIVMQRYLVSDTRLDKKPWRYVSIDGFEILSRASQDATEWMMDSLRLGRGVEDQILPAEWLPPSPVPETIIIDDTDLRSVQGLGTRTQAIAFDQPDDAFTWGKLSSDAKEWNDHFEAHDQDTYALNVDVHGADTHSPACSMRLGRIFACTPALPHWLTDGLLGSRCGVFRESFMPKPDWHREGWLVGAVGPGTLWISIEETRRMLAAMKDSPKGNAPEIPMLPMAKLFSETPPAAGDMLLWESEAALFVRWGLLGPGREDPVTARAFQDLVRRNRSEPITEAVFVDCFGFGYGAMEQKLASFLKVALAQPTYAEFQMWREFDEPSTKKATADQIGRILGDWMRMEADSARSENPVMATELMKASGRMLERAYRYDNGLPPDAGPAAGNGKSSGPPADAHEKPVLAMKPFLVSADRIHDPRLLSVYGMFEHDLGDDPRASELLNAAARAKVVRSQAYLSLAEIRYADSKGSPKGLDGKLSLGQVRFVLGPIEAALLQRRVPGAYSLMVETWENSEAHPSTADVDRLREGVSSYPRYTSLAYHAAGLCNAGGFPDAAEEMIRVGLRFSEGPRARKEFESLRFAVAKNQVRSP